MATDRFHHVFIAPSDYDKSLAFYRDTLGWTVTDGWVEDGSGRGAVLSGGGIKLVLAERKRNVRRAGVDGDAGSRPTLHLDIHDIDARFRSIPKGPHIVTAPEKTSWGTRWFVVRDPDGNLIAFEEIRPRRGA